MGLPLTVPLCASFVGAVWSHCCFFLHISHGLLHLSLRISTNFIPTNFISYMALSCLNRSQLDDLVWRPQVQISKKWSQAIFTGVRCSPLLQSAMAGVRIEITQIEIFFNVWKVINQGWSAWTFPVFLWFLSSTALPFWAQLSLCLHLKHNQKMCPGNGRLLFKKTGLEGNVFSG